MSIIWKLTALIVVAVVIFILISTINGFFTTATVLLSVVDFVGFLLSLIQVIRNDWKKYFPNSKSKLNDEDSYS